ncbi:phospholipase D-like domain-containing protein [Paraburkholderia phenazinium]|uniref:Phospholipase D1/2 n=1 Tax=Paraburkholderia phenazinium TaxID=60549 RepID=A0A1G7W8L8_9BURK|nr:phospholipase D-like domain-containing protein [Paraburkholderia phenazinium]SDG68281.1 phospholipase D1/2 [Paraburkholderia phenazinium]
MAQLPLETHNPMDVAIDEAGRSAQGSVQWLLETGVDDDVKPTTGNDLEFFVCGEEGFQSIASKIMAARATVDICCWGFDPGMEIWRGATAPAGVGAPYPKMGTIDLDKAVLGSAGIPDVINPAQPGGESDAVCTASPPPSGVWPRGVVYGALLEEITQRKENPVTVRLMIWFDPYGSRIQNSMPGFTDVPVGWTSPGEKAVQQDPPYANSMRNQYCVDWWKRNLPDGEDKLDGKRSGIRTKNQRLQIVLRSIASDDVKTLITTAPKEEDAPSTYTEGPKETLIGTSEKGLLENYPTHHQKPILIDYNYDNGSKAVGYVMGLNSVTDYWDRTAHEIDDPLREEWTPANVQAELKHEQETQDPAGPLSKAEYKHTNPYQDYACLVIGKALKRLHQNFERGWKPFAPDAWQKHELPSLPSKIPSLPDDPAYRVQIVRTQPHEHEKNIKKVYLQATSFARNYIYMENQYFFYPEFARHLKQERQKFHDAWAKLANKPQQDAPMLHLFVVTPHPQDPGMVPRTYDTMAELGHGDAWKDESVLSDKGKTKEKYTNDKGENTFHPESAQELQDTIGLKVSIARLRTSGMTANQVMAYREIYIHAKLMLIDDVFVTVGSANMNQRSMSVDSEINLAATGQKWAAGLRERVFSLLSGTATAGSGDRDQVPAVYDTWEGRMKDNNDIRKEAKEQMQGFILPFIDRRAKTVLHAQIDVPSPTNVSSTA